MLPSGRFRARYTGPDGNRHSAPITFVAKIDAEGWLVDQERLISRGQWRPPTGQLRETRLLMGEYRARCSGTPTNSARNDGALRETAPAHDPAGLGRPGDRRHHRRRDRRLVRRDAEYSDRLHYQKGFRRDRLRRKDPFGVQRPICVPAQTHGSRSRKQSPGSPGTTPGSNPIPATTEGPLTRLYMPKQRASLLP